MSSSDKQRFELNVFNEFLLIADLNAHSVRQLEPPNPDICCILQGEDRGFELTLLTDEAIETKIRRGRSGYSNFRIEIDDVINLVRKKSAKKYRGERIDLIVHEGATPIDGLQHYDQSHWNRVQAETNASQFATVWLLDISNNWVRSFPKARGT